MSKAKGPKKPRKNKRDVADVSWTGTDGNKKKAGPKTKDGTRKGKKDTADTDHMEEVPATKGKSKGKEKEKEVFKSREFIDDEDDEDEATVLPVVLDRSMVQPEPTSSNSINGVPDSDVDACRRERCAIAPTTGRLTVRKRSRRVRAMGMKKTKTAKGKGKGEIVNLSGDEASDDATREIRETMLQREKEQTGKNDADKGGENDNATEEHAVTLHTEAPVDRGGITEDNGGLDVDSGVSYIALHCQE
jgi:hypothetical protein